MKTINLLSIFFVLCFFSFKSYSQSPTWQWALSEGSTLNDKSLATCTDKNGKIYITGYYTGTVTFGSLPPLSSNGSGDIFIVKYDNTGNALLAKTFGGTGWDEGQSIVVDSLGNIYVAGDFETTVNFAPLPSITAAGLYDNFLLKLDPFGLPLWVRRSGGTVEEYPNQVAIDKSLNVYMAGDFKGTSTFGALPSITSSGGFDAYVAKYSSAGNEVWVKKGGSTGIDGGWGMDVTPWGTVYLSGPFSNTFTIGTQTIAATSGGTDVFLAKIDNLGNTSWVKSGGKVNQNDYSYCTYYDKWTNNVFISGVAYYSSFFGSIQLPSAITPNIAGGAMYGVKYDTLGNSLMALAGGTANFYSVAMTIFTDAIGNIYMSGVYANQKMVFAASTTTLANIGNEDVFVCAHNSSGSFLWATSGTGTGYENLGKMTYDKLGNIYVTGSTDGASATFNPNTVTNAGGQDVFLAKLSGAITGLNSSYQKVTSFDIISYPNPATNILNIESTNNIKFDAVIVLDITGRKVLEQKENTSQINIQSLEQGMYQLQITSEGKNYSSKFIKE